MYKTNDLTELFETGFNNYALNCLIDLCNNDDILEKYVYSDRLQCGCDKKNIDEIVDIINKNKNVVLDNLKDYNITANALNDKEKINALINAIYLTSDIKTSEIPQMDVEYMIASAIKANSFYHKDIFSELAQEDEKEAIDYFCKLYFNDQDNITNLKREIVNIMDDLIEDEDDTMYDFIESMLIGDNILEIAFYDFDYELIDEEPEYAKETINKTASLDDILKQKDKPNTINEALSKETKTKICEKLKQEQKDVSSSLDEINSYSMAGIQDHLNRTLYIGRLNEIKKDIDKIMNNGNIEDLSTETQRTINSMLENDEQIK